jgi:Flp pilus assembly protein TadB
MDIYLAGLILIIVAVCFVWVLGPSAWYWTAAKIMGWERQKFNHESAGIEMEAARKQRQYKKDAQADNLEKKAAREQLQHTKDVQADNHDRRRIGVAFVTIAIFILAVQMSIPWWTIAVVVVAAYIGLHMVAGVTIKWRW